MCSTLMKMCDCKCDNAFAASWIGKSTPGNADGECLDWQEVAKTTSHRFSVSGTRA